MNKNNICKIILLLVVFAFTQNTNAARLQYSKFLQGTGINGGSIMVMDDYWSKINAGTWSNYFTDKKVRNYVKLSFTGQSKIVYACGADIQVTVKFNYSGKDKSLATFSGTKTVVINNNYLTNTGVDVDLAELIHSTGLHYLLISGVTATATGTTGAVVPADVFLEAGIEVDRYFKLNETLPTVPNITNVYLSPTNQLELHWPYIFGAEEYDLEWYYVNENVANYATVTFANLDPKAFTRVTVRENMYPINLVFDKGKLFYRVRGVGRYGAAFEDVLEGVWSSDVTKDVFTINDLFVMNGTGLLSTNPLVSPDYKIKNWTYQQSFSEDGKHNEVVTFFDGSGRNRQAVTLSNTENTSMVGETYYDFEGRGMINVLPAPSTTHSSVLQYFKSFAINNLNNDILIKPDYDVYQTVSACADPANLQLKTTAGASNYYSTANTFKEGFNQYLPNAFMYPYAQTEFGPDGTVKRQSGPGEVFTMNSNQAIAYYHATPSQEALNRMLGSHAGYANNYILEAVEDANGQVALTYKDAQGHTVATTLTGQAPTGMRQLENNLGVTTFTQSLGSDYEVVSEPGYYTSQTIFLPATGLYEFVYKVNLEDYAALCTAPGGGCKYDLVLQIYDDCQAPVAESLSTITASAGVVPPPTTPVLYASPVHTFSGASTDFVEFKFSITASHIGNYKVVKKLTLNVAAFNTAVTNYETYLQTNLPATCITNNTLPIIPCDQTCADYCAMLAADGNPLNNCPVNYCQNALNAITANNNPCQDILTTLNNDLSPGGQYFNSTPGGVGVPSGAWFSTNLEAPYCNALLSCLIACAPCTLGTTITSVFWCDFSAINSTGAGGVFTSTIANWTELSAYLFANPTVLPGQIRIPVNRAGCTGTVNYSSLLGFHPEYCQYTKCTILNTVQTPPGLSSNQFDYQILTTGYADAIANGWITATCPVTPIYAGFLAAEPLSPQSLAASASPIFSAFLAGQVLPLTGGSDIWAEAAAACPGCTCDQIWQTFKGIYNSLKTKYINTIYPASCGYLCDLTVPADQYADDCTPAISTDNQAVGYQINFPGPSPALYDTYTGGTSDPEMSTIVDAANAYSINCKNYVDFNMCDLITDICTPNCLGSTPLSNYTTNGNLVCDQCVVWSSLAMVTQSAGLYVDGYNFDGLTATQTYFMNALNTFSLSCGSPTTFDYAGFSNAFITYLNTHTSVPELSAYALDGCKIRIYNNSTTSLAGKWVQFGAGNESAGFARVKVAPSTCLYTLGTFTYECQTLSEPDCFCTFLQMDYDAIYLHDPSLSATAIKTQMAADYNTNYFGGVSTVTYTDINTWMTNCTNVLVPCVTGGGAPNGQVCVPAGLLAECNPNPNCMDELVIMAGYYEDTDVQDQISQLVDDFKQYYYDECLKGPAFKETFTYKGADNEYNYSLFFYDQAGNLTATVPPKGVQLIPASMNGIIDANRSNPLSTSYYFVDPLHQMGSQYRYNSYNQVAYENVPDKTDVIEGAVVTNPDTGNFLDMEFFSATNGYALVNNAGTYSILSTTDGGTNWGSALALPAGVTTIYDFHYYTASNIAIISNLGLSFTSTSGSSWTTHALSNMRKISLDGTDRIFAYVASVLPSLYSFAVTDPLGSAFSVSVPTAITTTGSPLTSTLNSIIYSGNKLFVSNPTEVFVITLSSSIAGNSTISPVSPISITAMHYVSPSTIIIGGPSGASGGIYWINYANASGVITYGAFTASTGATYAGCTFNAFTQQSGGNIYAVGSDGTVLSSSDYAISWSALTVASGIVYKCATIVPGSATVMFGANGNIPYLAGIAKDQWFYYDDLGRIKASQNSKQFGYSTKAYAFSVYDAQGRVTEAGEVTTNQPIPTRAQLNDVLWPNTWVIFTDIKREVTYSTYDNPSTDALVMAQFNTGAQTFMRKRVSSTIFKNFANLSFYEYASFYSYDVHGNVSEFVRDIKPLEEFNQRFKKFDYTYDLVSGNVNDMVYQKNKPDVLMHRYYYDANNRLTWAYTSRNGLTWDNDAKYFYNLHGPLARTEIGQYKVQNMDYAYTLQGWLKGVNSGILDNEKEMGQDGKITTTTPNYLTAFQQVHRNAARDAFGYVLGYYGTVGLISNGDYQSITGTTGNDWLQALPITLGANLFNGNIRNTAVSMLKEDESLIQNRATAYEYDQLNRLAKTTQHLTAATNYAGISPTTSFGEEFFYDPNGNINKLQRKDDAGALMDDFTYNYYGTTNKLAHVDDNAVTAITTDMEDQNALNYSYDAIGQLTADVKEGLTGVTWNARGKVLTVDKAGINDVDFAYDEMGQRVMKKVRTGNEVGWSTQWYVRDPQGNVIAVYNNTFENRTSNIHTELFKLIEHDLYGSARLGVRNYADQILYQTNFNYSGTSPASYLASGEYNPALISGLTVTDLTNYNYKLNKRELGNKNYEINNHLGNIQVVVSDYKMPKTAASCTAGAVVSYYMPDVISYSDYYSFGSLMVNRYTVSGNYRFGFTGKEKDPEIKGEGNSIDFGARILDPRLGRWLSCDPLAAKYPGASPYNSCLNNPIASYDPNGEYVIFINGEVGQFGSIGKSNSKDRANMSYWTSNFVSIVTNGLNDHKIKFLDGDQGSSAGTRKSVGSQQAKTDFAKIIEQLSKNKDGKINETVRVISHSKGSAYAAGYIEVWNELRNSDEYKDLFTAEGGRVDFNLMLSAHQGSDFSLTNPMGTNINIHHDYDDMAWSNVQGDVFNIQTDNDSWLFQHLRVHTIDGFHFEAKAAINTFMSSNKFINSLNISSNLKQYVMKAFNYSGYTSTINNARKWVWNRDEKAYYGMPDDK